MRQGSTYTAHEQSTIRAGGAAAVLPAQNHHMSVAGPTRGDEHKADQQHRPTGLERVTVERGALTSTGLEPELDQRFHVHAATRNGATMNKHEHDYFEIVFSFGNQWQCDCGYEPDETEWNKWRDLQDA